MKNLRDKVAVVTGGASGIGRGMARQFIEAGMKVVLSDVDHEKLTRTVAELKQDGGQAIGVVADVSKADQVEHLAQEALDAFGVVHILCNNAGVSYGGGKSWETDLSGWHWVLDVNLMGTVNGIHTFLPIMLKQDVEGHVVNTASLTGLVINPVGIPYAVSKHAIVALSESMHDELSSLGSKIKVSVLCPGPIHTDIMNSVERNCPSGVPPSPDPTQEEALFKKAYETWLERGMSPLEVGRMVVEAIRNEQFYIITHDFDRFIEERMRNILHRKNPEISTVLNEVAEIAMELMTRQTQGGPA